MLNFYALCNLHVGYRYLTNVSLLTMHVDLKLTFSAVKNAKVSGYSRLSSHSRNQLFGDNI